MSQPSTALVTDSCLSICKSMKLMSKQLVSFSASYSKIPFKENNNINVINSILEIIKDVNSIQKVLTELAKDMKIEIENMPQSFIPENVTITGKEYILLNNVFQEYTKLVSDTSDSFTLFSSPLLYKEDGNEEKNNS